MLKVAVRKDITRGFARCGLLATGRTCTRITAARLSDSLCSIAQHHACRQANAHATHAPASSASSAWAAELASHLAAAASAAPYFVLFITRRATCPFLMPVPDLCALHVPVLRGMPVRRETTEHHMRARAQRQVDHEQNYTGWATRNVKIASRASRHTHAGDAAYRESVSVTDLSPPPSLGKPSVKSPVYPPLSTQAAARRQRGGTARERQRGGAARRSAALPFQPSTPAVHTAGSPC